MVSRYFIQILLIFAVNVVSLPCGAQISTPDAGQASTQWLDKYVVSPGGNFAGREMGEFVIAWWQWALSFPKEESPMRDVTGKNCAMGQTGDVWFLGGASGGGRVRRTCDIQEGKAIFFPLITAAFYARPDVASRCVDTTADAAVNNDHLAYAQVWVNGVEVPRANRYRARSSGCFAMFSNERAKAHGSTGYPAAADGYWILLRPLPAGDYVLKYRAAYNLPDERLGTMAQDVEYRIRILPQ